MNEVFLPHAAIEVSDKWRLHGIQSTILMEDVISFIFIQKTVMGEIYQLDIMRDEQNKWHLTYKHKK